MTEKHSAEGSENKHMLIAEPITEDDLARASQAIRLMERPEPSLISHPVLYLVDSEDT